MERELDCEIVKDLLPLYVDGMASEISKKSIKNHLKGCSDCLEIYENMSAEIEEKEQPEVEDVQRFLKRTKLMYFLYALGGISMVAIITCMIVDLALNKGITWSLIVAASIVFTDAVLYSALSGKKNKGLNTMSVISIGTACLLLMIQITRYYLMNVGSFWIIRYGYPILLVWLAVIWTPMLCRHFFKWNLWDCIAVFLIAVIVGNYATKLITGDYVWNRDLWNLYNFLGNALGEMMGAVLFGILGRIKKWRK
ncbi:MAG: hypothetical protein HDR22_05455 [Lachnospiraceae bacterium]|nr:hypothetical protein [Lachnospiraceae bacterium]